MLNIGAFLNLVFVVIADALVTVGFVEFIKKFLPEAWKTGWKVTLISGGVGAIIAITSVLITGFFAVRDGAAVVVATIALSTLLYKVVIKLATKIEDYLKSKILKK